MKQRRKQIVIQKQKTRQRTLGNTQALFTLQTFLLLSLLCFYKKTRISKVNGGEVAVEVTVDLVVVLRALKLDLDTRGRRWAFRRGRADDVDADDADRQGGGLGVLWPAAGLAARGGLQGGGAGGGYMGYDCGGGGDDVSDGGVAV